MPDYSKQIVYLSQTQYQELITNESITVNGVTINYNDNDLYVTPQAEPITDVRINGVSVTANGAGNIPLASTSNFGVISVRAGTDGLTIDSSNPGRLVLSVASSASIKNGTALSAPITPVRQHESVFYGLSKIAGVDLASETVTVGTYPDASKGAIQTMLGVDALIAPTESSTMASQAYAINDLFLNGGKLYKATAAISEGAAFDSTSNCQVTSIAAEMVRDVQVNGTSVISNGVANIPLASSSAAGVGKVNDNGIYGIYMLNGNIAIKGATPIAIKAGANGNNPITPLTQNEATFYGLAKAAGDTTQASSANAVGTYTTEAKAAIRSMIGAENGDDLVKVQDIQPSTAATKLWFKETQDDGVSVPTVSEMETALAGKVGDVQVNGASVVSSGVANIPVAGSGTATLGVVYFMPNNYGIGANSSGRAYIQKAQESEIKAGIKDFVPIVPLTQHISTFYGLASAAGDATQAASSNAVGTYTDSAKNAIHTMLGTADLIEVGFVETVTGSTPSITGKANYRYNCGEVSTLSITPPVAGSIDVYFTSGSTATVLTVPNTVKWPAWFDATSLDSNTIYELLITDATYGSVMTWAT